MRKLSSLHGAIVLIAVLFTVLFIACRKTDQQGPSQAPIEKKISQNFFPVSPGTDDIVHTVAKKIEKQNEQSPFIQSLVKRVGYPDWDHSLIADGPGQPRPAAKKGNTEIKNDQRIILYIPFAKEEERKTKSVLRVIIDKTDTTFEMLYPQQYKKYGFHKHSATSWNAQDLFNVFANFDHALFGTSKFLVKDGRIFGKEKSDWLIVERKMKDEVAAGSNLAARLYSIEVCAYTTACVYASDSPYDGGNCVTSMSCTSYWVDDGAGSTGGGGSTDTGGGGTADDWVNDPCDESSLAQRLAEPVAGPSDNANPCGDGPWEPAQQKGKVCGEYSLQIVGNSYTGSIKYLRYTFAQLDYPYESFHLNFVESCLEVPKYGITVGQASAIFNKSFNEALEQTQRDLNSGLITKMQIYNRVKVLTQNKLRGYSPGATWGTALCFGNLPASEPEYCGW